MSASVTALRPVNSARDVVAVAFQRAMSNGPISRRLGWIALLLLPLTNPMPIPGVFAGGNQALRARGASLMRGRVVRVRPGALCAAMLGPFLFFLVLVLLHRATGFSSGWLFAGALVLIIVELTGSLFAQAVRRAWRAAHHRTPAVRTTTSDTEAHGPAVTITFVAAFPRNRGRGSALMDGLEVLLDAEGETAELTARTNGLIGFYERHGFHSQDADPRQMLRHPRPIAQDGGR